MPCCGRPMTIGVAATDDPGRLRVRCPCGAAWTVLDLLDGDDESDDGPTDDADDEGHPDGRHDRSFPVTPSRARPYAGAAAAMAQAEATAPRQVPAVAAAIGASGMWSCGHQGTIATAVTSRDPRASRCRECGATGLVSQLTADGWAPIGVVGDAPPEEPSRTAKRPGRVVAPARFAGAVSPSQAAGPGYWQPVEDRRPGAAERVPVPRYAGGLAGPIPPMQGVTTAGYPLAGA